MMTTSTATPTTEEKIQKRLIGERKRRTELEEKLKNCNDRIAEYESMLRERRFNAAEEVLHVLGIEMEELMAGLQSGEIDISPLQRK